MYQVLIGLMAAAATYATPVAFRPIDTWPAALGIPQATTHDLLDSPSTSERCHLRIETSWMTKHRGTLPDPPTAGYKREPLNQCPLGHGALLGRHSLCSMYQVLIGLMAAAATYATPVAFRPIDTWPAALGIPQATTHDLLDSPSTSERCHLRIETSWMTKHRGTLPDPPTAGYKREPLNQCPLGHGALLGRHSLCSMYQVSYLCRCNCFRSSDDMLLRVPCPINGKWLIWTCYAVSRECMAAALNWSVLEGYDVASQTLLLLAGDIEQNPGPMSVPEREQISKIEEMLKVLQSGQVTVLEKLSGIAKTQDELRKKLDDVITKTNVIEKRLTTLEETEKKFADKLDDLENRSRRTNLVFFGIPDSHPKETWEESENLVKSVCTDVLKLENIAIERAHRLGAYKTERIRPIIASFSGSKSRESVLRNAYRFKGTSYSVSEDFSKAVQEKRRQLWKYSKEKQLDKKNRVHLSYDKLVINGQAFAWDTDMHQPVPLRAHAQILGRK
nr:uncharacterized protein LOC119166647 [Rhipicephalus microplus]